MTRTRQLTYWAPDAGENPEPVLEPRAGALWGYSIKRLDDLACYAVKGHLHWWGAGDRGDQKQAAWEGITEYLLTATECPSENDLIWAGTRAIAAEVQAEKRHRGVPHDASVTAEKFGVYWQLFTQPFPSPEEGVTDRLAVRQILATLTRRQMEAVEALAAYGDYAAAARAMGVPYKTFHRHLSVARERFRSLWFEGETPPARQWRQDRRADMTWLSDEEICGSDSGYNRHLSRREQACDECRDAHNAAGRAGYARRKSAAQRRAA